MWIMPRLKNRVSRAMESERGGSTVSNGIISRQSAPSITHLIFLHEQVRQPPILCIPSLLSLVL